jgi:hypothetical protein
MIGANVTEMIAKQLWLMGGFKLPGWKSSNQFTHINNVRSYHRAATAAYDEE